MKTFVKTFICALAASTLLLACNDTASITGDGGSAGGNTAKSQTQPDIAEVPAMNSNVVSYRSHLASDEYTARQLGEELYGQGFVTDKEILKIWFSHIFSGNQAKSECNYFALHFTNSSSGLAQSYEILSQDMALSHIACAWKGTGGSTADFAKRAMLVCDDENWKLKESIDLDAISFSNDPNWDCESGTSGPSWEKIYF